MEKPILKCPVCDSTLTVTHQERYQDTSEHVSQPNMEPSVKDGYECGTETCIAHKCKVSWIEDGEYYYGQRTEGVSYSELRDALNEKHGTAYAVGSWNFYYELGKQATEKRTWKIKLLKYKFNFIPKPKGHKYPTSKQYQPHLWKKKLEIWKLTVDNSYKNVIPFWRMMKYCIGQFKMNYRNWKANGSKSCLDSAYNEAMGFSPWGKVDDRFYAKMSKLWIQTFYPNRVKEVITAKENC
jgi:hypothetical protein